MPAVDTDDENDGYPRVTLAEMLDDLCIADDDYTDADTAGASAMMMQ